MEKRRILKTLLGTALAIAITFAAVPQTAKAYSPSQLNTNGVQGKTHTIKSYFPGIGYQKINVKFESITKEDGAFRYGSSYYPAKKANVVVRCTLPKATLNKIKQNTVKMYKASKYKTANNNFCIAVLDAETGCAFNSTNMVGKAYAASISQGYNTKRTTYRQTADHFRVTYPCLTTWTQDVTVYYPPANEGNILVGVAGTAKEVSVYSTKRTNFTSGSSPITSSVFFKKKMKNLSIWTRI
ncbi:hypothetical protein [Butyrivibrio sp. AE3004]|uniref:hypothetical protein n=1 Tax=Butyrivibrio sp. AE3004 TaxID=1506994 RepID=UPI000493DB2A|nr:hypothetical protein [Butyrivibrio sp. AE3004]